MKKGRKVLEFKGIVKSIKKGEVAHIEVITIASDDESYEIFLDVHEKLRVFNKGDKVVFAIHGSRPRFNPDDFVGKGTVFKLSKENGHHKLLISIGGLLLMLKSKEKINKIKVGDEVYVKISKRKTVS